MRMLPVEIPVDELERAFAAVARLGRECRHFRIVGCLSPALSSAMDAPAGSHVEISVTYPGVPRAIYRRRATVNWVSDFERDLAAGRFEAQRIGMAA